MPRILAFLFPTIILFGGGAYLFSPEEKEVVQTPTMTTEVIGTSVEGREIIAHHFGSGEHHLVIVGGIHGGYEWNTTALSEVLAEHIETNPSIIGKTMMLTIIPTLNPDGLYSLVGSTTGISSLSIPNDPEQRAQARFNANNVDLNRNFDCKWQEESTWGTQIVSAGDGVFSEPETQALKAFVEDRAPDAFIFLHSKANAVYGSECEEGVLQATGELLQVYADASGYTPVLIFDSYPITGDAEGWLASQKIPAITVELATHEDTEFQKNLRGIESVLGWMAQW